MTLPRRSIWVVGSTGKIGRALTRRLLEQGDEVIRFGRSHDSSSTKDFDVHWELSHSASIPADIAPPDCVFFLAGQTSSTIAKMNVVNDINTNVTGIVRTIEAALHLVNRPHFICAGAATESVLDQLGLASRGATDAPSTFYETGKAAQRLYLTQFAREGLLDFTFLRLANVYGGGLSSSLDRGFLDQCIVRAVRGLDVSYFAEAPMMRDYVHIDDVVNAFVAAMEFRSTLSNQTFNIGTGHSLAVSDVLRLLQNVVHRELRIDVGLSAIATPAGLPSIDRMDRYVDPSDFELTTGWRAHLSIEEGLTRSVIDSHALLAS